MVFDSESCLWLDAYEVLLSHSNKRLGITLCGNAVIRVYDAAGNVIEMHEHKGEFKEW
jgi:hypothetical protein